MKFFWRIILGLLAIVLLLIGGIAIWLTSADLKPIVEQAASDALGRKVVAEEFSISWGDPLHIELSNLRIANAPWGSEENMIALRHFSADVEAMSLWRGMPIYRHLRADGLQVVLERDQQGAGNWKFSADSSSGGFALIPKNRTQFPTLLDMVMKDALITYRTYAGNTLRIQLDNIAIASQDDVSPVELKAAGAYNNTPLGLTANTASFRDMRNAKKPFKTALLLFGKTSRLTFDGTQMEPLDFDGVDGALTLKADELDNLLGAFGADIAAEYPLVIDAHLTREGDHWELTRAKGKLDQANFNGQLMLDEGRRGAPDRLKTDLAFARLDLDRLLSDEESGGEAELSAPKESGIVLDVRLRADQFVYRHVELRDIEVDGHIAPGRVDLKSLKFPYAGGRISAQLQVAQSIEAGVTIDGIDADKLAQQFGAESGDLSGKIAGRLKLTMPAGDIQQGLAKSHGGAILSMSEAGIRRAILEKMSTDLRTLFREKEGSAPIHCLGGIFTLKDGIATVAPLRLIAKDAVINGGGTIDLTKRSVDLHLQSERSSTGFFAFDLPVSISGSIDNLQVGLADKGENNAVPPAAPQSMALDPVMQPLVNGNACLN